MEIFLGDLLKKYKAFIPTEEKVREIFTYILKEKYNIVLKKDQVSFSQGRIFVSGSPHLKGLIYRNKEGLIYELKKRLDVHIKDVR